MNIAFIGFGNVGAPLADQLQRLGHHVVLAARDPESASVKAALQRNANLSVATPTEAVEQAEVVFLATPYQANEAALKEVQEQLKGKILVDCTNPVGANLSHGLNSEQSGSEVIQAMLPNTQVVKAFTIYGFENFEIGAIADYPQKPVMMYCGDDVASKQTVGEMIAQLGWEPLDVGGLNQALHLEHMTLLWVRMVRVNGASPYMVWAKLGR